MFIKTGFWLSFYSYKGNLLSFMIYGGEMFIEGSKNVRELSWMSNGVMRF